MSDTTGGSPRADSKAPKVANPRKLKVFQAQFGFYDTVVAAPSQAAALRAWGIHQNLFADGQARVTTDEQAIAAALAHPETPLKRAVGSSDPFLLEPISLPKAPDAPERSPVQAAATAKSMIVAPPPPKPPPDRSALDAAEAALRKLDDGRREDEAALQRRQAALDLDRAKSEAAYTDARMAATAAVVLARQAYRKAGGED